MKTYNSIYSAAILLGLGLAGATQADFFGGGPGYPATPYPDDVMPTLEQVLAEMQADVTAATIVEAQTASGLPASGYNVGVAYVAGNSMTQPAFELRGVDEQGQERLVALANLYSFKLIRITGRAGAPDVAVVELTEFPTLTPQELLSGTFTYTDLITEHSRTFELLIDLQAGDGGQLAFVGGNYDTDTSYRVVSLIRELTPGIDITFEQGGVDGPWWAVPTVIADPAYPFRYVILN